MVPYAPAFQRRLYYWGHDTEPPSGPSHGKAETHLPATQQAPPPYARLPRPHVDERRSQGPGEPSPQGPPSPYGFDLQEVVAERRPNGMASQGGLPSDGSPCIGLLARRTFGRDRRIRRRSDFVRVQSSGERATSRHFVLLVAARRDPADADELARSPSRLGIVVTRKVGNAVARNRIKRVCRECFRSWLDFVPNGIDLVVIARAGAHELPLRLVREEWARARPLLLKRCDGVLRQRMAESVSGKR